MSLKKIPSLPHSNLLSQSPLQNQPLPITPPINSISIFLLRLRKYINLSLLTCCNILRPLPQPHILIPPTLFIPPVYMVRSLVIYYPEGSLRIGGEGEGFGGAEGKPLLGGVGVLEDGVVAVGFEERPIPTKSNHISTATKLHPLPIPLPIYILLLIYKRWIALLIHRNSILITLRPPRLTLILHPPTLLLV